MARRLKEMPSIHRNRIADAAESLFKDKGINETSMSEIASKAGYSKATVYVYFKNKDELVGYLVLTSMVKLKEYLNESINNDNSFKEKFLEICHSLSRYENEYPFYFSIILKEININFQNSNYLESELQAFKVGEEINLLLVNYLLNGIKNNEIKNFANLKTLIFNLWGMISGVINIAHEKKQYISQEIGSSNDEFLNEGFGIIYEAIKKN